MNVALRSPRCIALCAGVGGLDLGVSLALPGSRTVCYVEREIAAAASLAASIEAGWFHPAPVWSDMRTFDAGRWRGAVDLVTSGDPCQGNSVAGKRLGQLDDRWLLDRAIDIFAASGARYFFRENVPGNADGQLAVAVPALEGLGCRVASGIFSSAETGNTMRRERLFILAVRNVDGPASPERRPINRSRGTRGRNALSQRQEGAARAGKSGTELGSPASPRSIPGAQPGTHRRDERPGPRDAQPERRSGNMARPIGPVEAGRQPTGGETAGGRPHGQPGGSGGTLGRSGGDEPQGQQPGQHHPAGWQVKDGPAALSGRAGLRSGALPPAIIPGPSDSRWIDLLDRFPEYQPALSAEEAESHIRRGIDAMAHRIERLRATGNGVDPVAAAYAFLSLGSRLGLFAAPAWQPAVRCQP